MFHPRHSYLHTVPMTVTAWYMDDSSDDQRLPHRRVPDEPVSLEKLASMGVHHWQLDPSKYESDPELQAIRDEYGFSYTVCEEMEV